MDLAALLAVVREEYPNGETDATIVRYMQSALNQVAKFFKRYRMVSFLTVADQDEYAFEYDIDTVVSLGISSTDTPEDRYDYEKYDFIPHLNYPQSRRGYWQITDDAGDRYIVLYPCPREDDLVVSVTLDVPPTALDSADTTQVPEIPERYHELLSMYACSRVAAMGSAPDTTQAMMFGNMFFESAVQDLEMEQMQAEQESPDHAVELPHWRHNRRHAHNAPIVLGGPV